MAKTRPLRRPRCPWTDACVLGPHEEHPLGVVEAGELRGIVRRDLVT